MQYTGTNNYPSLPPRVNAYHPNFDAGQHQVNPHAAPQPEIGMSHYGTGFGPTPSAGSAQASFAPQAPSAPQVPMRPAFVPPPSMPATLAGGSTREVLRLPLSMVRAAGPWIHTMEMEAIGIRADELRTVYNFIEQVRVKHEQRECMGTLILLPLMLCWMSECCCFEGNSKDIELHNRIREYFDHINPSFASRNFALRVELKKEAYVYAIVDRIYVSIEYLGAPQ